MNLLDRLGQPKLLGLQSGQNQFKIQLIFRARIFGLEQQYQLWAHKRDAIPIPQHNFISGFGDRRIALEAPNSMRTSLARTWLNHNVEPPFLYLFVETPHLMNFCSCFCRSKPRNFSTASSEKFTIRQGGAKLGQIFAQNRNFDIIMGPGLFSQPKIDGPTTNHAPWRIDAGKPLVGFVRCPRLPCVYIWCVQFMKPKPAAPSPGFWQ
jgi:hypothetical protein